MAADVLEFTSHGAPPVCTTQITSKPICWAIADCITNFAD